MRRAELTSPRSDVVVLLVTFGLTVLVDLIEVGMILAAFLFMRRMAALTNVSAVTSEAYAARPVATPSPEGDSRAPLSPSEVTRCPLGASHGPSSERSVNARHLSRVYE